MKFKQVPIDPEIFNCIRSVGQTLNISPDAVVNEILRQFFRGNWDSHTRMLVRLASEWEYDSLEQANEVAERLAVMAVEDQLEPKQHNQPETGLLNVHVSSPSEDSGFSGDWGWFLGAMELRNGEWRQVT